MAQIEISPSSFIGTRLSVLAKVYDKYRFTKCQVRYVPSVPTTVGGQFVMYFDLDVGDLVADVSSVEVAVRNAMAHQGAELCNVYNSGMTTMPIAPGLKDFFTGAADGDNKLFRQAKFWMVATAGLNGTGLPASGVVGSLFLDYTIHFEGEQLQDKTAVEEEPFIDSALRIVANSGTIANTVTFSSAGTRQLLFGGYLLPGYDTSLPNGVYKAITGGLGAGTTGPAPFLNRDPRGATSSTLPVLIVNRNYSLWFCAGANGLSGATVIPLYGQWISALTVPGGAQNVQLSAASDEVTAGLVNALSQPPVSLASMRKELEVLRQQVCNLSYQDQVDGASFSISKLKAPFVEMSDCYCQTDCRKEMYEVNGGGSSESDGPEPKLSRVGDNSAEVLDSVNLA